MGTDRQTDKECTTADQHFLHQELKPHEAAVFASDHDRSLIDANDFQNRARTGKIKHRPLGSFDHLVNKTVAVSDITGHHELRTVSVCCAPSEPLMPL